MSSSCTASTVLSLNWVLRQSVLAPFHPGAFHAGTPYARLTVSPLIVHISPASAAMALDTRVDRFNGPAITILEFRLEGLMDVRDEAMCDLWAAASPD
jgi:hypothetical protein